MANKEIVIEIDGQEGQTVTPVEAKIKTSIEDFYNQLSEIFMATSNETKS
jgi:hypothetical protein